MPNSRQSDPFYDQELPVEGITAISNSHKHETDVEDYVEQQKLPPADRAIYVLQNGTNLQKHSIMENMGRLMQDCAPCDMSRVIAEIGELIWKMDQDLQILAAGSFQKTMSFLKPRHMQEIFSILKTMISIRNEAVREKWKPCILEAIQYFPKEQLQAEMIRLAVEKGELSEPQDSRQLSCEMFGALAKRFDASSIEKLFLQRALSLCQDTDYTVRSTMCAQLNIVARAIGLDYTKQVITKEIIELLADEEHEVAHTAFTTLVEMIDFFDEIYRHEVVYPLVRSQMTNPPESSHRMLLSVLGKCMCSLSVDMTSEEDVMLFYNFFKTSAQRADSEAQSSGLRPLCAYNFPAVVSSVGVKRFNTHLQTTFKFLCEDSCVETRRRMAAGFHEVSFLLGDRALSLLKDSFLVLIQDCELEVQEAIFSHVSEILHHFSQHSNAMECESFYSNCCVSPIVSYENVVKTKWRRIAELLDHFEHFPSFFSVDVLHDHFLPILFRHLFSGSCATKDKCAELIMLFTRKLNNNQQQVEIFNRLLHEFGRSKSYWHRQSFVSICYHCLRYFSRKFFRERFLETALELAKDPVSNVRRSMCAVLPPIAKALRPPAASADCIAGFNEKVIKLTLDNDKDVCAAATDAQLHIDHLSRELRKKQEMMVSDEEDKLDAHREEEENALFEAAQEQEKQQRRKALRELLAEGEKNLPPGTSTQQLAPGGRGRSGINRKSITVPRNNGAVEPSSSSASSPNRILKPNYANLSPPTSVVRPLNTAKPTAEKTTGKLFPTTSGSNVTGAEARKSSLTSHERNPTARKNSATSSIPSPLPTLTTRHTVAKKK